MRGRDHERAVPPLLCLWKNRSNTGATPVKHFLAASSDGNKSHKVRFNERSPKRPPEYQDGLSAGRRQRADWLGKKTPAGDDTVATGWGWCGVIEHGRGGWVPPLPIVGFCNHGVQRVYFRHFILY